MEGKRLCLDMIGNLPPPIIENILCLVPIQEAARTSILSKEWRYHWTKIPKLVFTNCMIKAPVEGYISGQRDFSRIRYEMLQEVFNAINQVLQMHQGPIEEFTLSYFTSENSVEIDNIITHLVRNNAVKKLNLWLGEYRLPISIFSLRHLTDLCLDYVNLDHEPPFSGFGSLTSLHMKYVRTTKKKLLHLLSNCPLLKSFTLGIDARHFQDSEDYTITNLFECLPMIENLSVSLSSIECFAKGGVPKKLPTALDHLKYLAIDSMCFFRKYGLPILALFIRISPNLEKLKLKMTYPSLFDGYDNDIDSVAMKDYSDIWLEHLNELEIIYLSFMTPYLDFVKLILAKSHVLKKVRIVLCNSHEKWRILRELCTTPHASTDVDFFFTKHSRC